MLAPLDLREVRVGADTGVRPTGFRFSHAVLLPSACSGLDIRVNMVEG